MIKGLRDFPDFSPMQNDFANRSGRAGLNRRFEPQIYADLHRFAQIHGNLSVHPEPMRIM
jgi:hypothetical protein